MPGPGGTRFRFCCRLGRLSVYEEPSERHAVTVNIGRLAEVRRRALLAVGRAKSALPSLRALTREEELACWAKAVADPETRFFETLNGGPERLGGRWQTLRALASVLEAVGREVPWPDRPDLA